MTEPKDTEPEYTVAEYTIPTGLALRILELLRIAPAYVLKDSHPETLGEDFKAWKWTNEIEFAQKCLEAHREALTVFGESQYSETGCPICGKEVRRDVLPSFTVELICTDPDCLWDGLVLETP